MAEPLRELTVFLRETVAGRLTVDRAGAMAFRYDADWLADPQAPPLFQSLPKTAEAVGDRLCKAVFGGLLPEEAQRSAVARALGISPDNTFRLLERLGGDVAGALSFLPPGEEPASAAAPALPHEPLDDDELVAIMLQLPVTPMLAGEGGLRLSLAGAQDKLPVVLQGGAVALPHPGEPSTHLIKPEPARFPGLAANEAFCLALARACGLAAVQAERRVVAERPFLLVERYDRETANGATLRLHQEDFAQSLGVVPSRKYAAEGGPAFRDAFALVRSATTRPAREVLRLLDAALFNLVIGNADAHAKNFSLLHRDGRAGRETILAPLYDLVTTFRWPGLAPHLAMRFGNARRLEEVDGASFERFADQAGVGAPFVRRRAGEIAELVLDHAERIGSAEDTELRDALTSRAQTLRQKAGR
ncbi:type II toxin-antitoxin system HipA family toxin [Qipengyuania pelagi]|uniref:type II toxin-antitoxin system HipA family toxin n=1 Tax=Qipengyuania pelagi TaxID=994320 RepID=UPI002FE82A42